MAKATKKENLLINGIDFEEWIEDSDAPSLSSVEEQERKYEKRLVAFLDLLGITYEVLTKVNGAENEIISKMLKIKEIVEREIRDVDITMLYISDSFIFVCKPEMLPVFLKTLANIQMRVLVECKTMLRGAVEYGDVIIEDDGKQIIGPAYIDAYIKQEKHAIYPRIILGNSVVSLISQAHGADGKLVISQDREYSLDYLDVYMEIEQKSKRDLQTRFRREGIYDYLLDSYLEYHKKDNPSVRAKYAWTINYLREKGVWPNAAKYNNW